MVLSNALPLLLLGVVAVGAASTLALITASRRDEFTLLHRTGTTRRQLLAMTGVESLITGLTAWALGTVAVIPAVISVTASLLPGRLPIVDLTAYGMVSAGVLALRDGQRSDRQGPGEVGDMPPGAHGGPRHGNPKLPHSRS